MDGAAIGLDVGDARIGVAESDGSGILASPRSAIARDNEVTDVAAVLRAATEANADLIVVGMPLTLSGGTGMQARKTRWFVNVLKRHTEIRVVTWDERFSTAEAERGIRQAGGKPSRDRGRLDSAAAAIILQSYLDSH